MVTKKDEEKDETPKVIETGSKAANTPGQKPTPGAEATLEDGSKLVRVPPGSKVVAPDSINGPNVQNDPAERIVGDFKANDPARALADPDSIDPSKKVAKLRAEQEAKKMKEPGGLKEGHVAAKVLHPVRSEGKRYEPGSYVQLPKDEAEALALAGVVELDKPLPKDAGPKPDPGPTDPTFRRP